MKVRITLSTKKRAVTVQVVPALRTSNYEVLLEVLDLGEERQRPARVSSSHVEGGCYLIEVTVGPKDESETRAQVLGFVLRRLAALGIPWELSNASS